ncbi:MAG: hypothetical protein GY705_27045, partial [Bacteroidetes bacterium]|nr:hypothetical protein [Bacteroidota bacterium]
MRYLLLLLLFTFSITGCSSLPHYAAPHMDMGGQAEDLHNGLSYRKLKISDFKAPALSDRLRVYSDRLNAHTKVIIYPKKSIQYTISSSEAFAQVVYHGRVEDVSFEALMLPNSSWWNHKMPNDKKAYVLQHEQIHFGLLEITAQKMTQEFQHRRDSFSVFCGSKEEVHDVLNEKISTYIEKAMEAAVAEHTRF